MQAQPVLEVLSNRIIYRNLGLGKADDFKLGLGVDGGAMRGAISLGMLIALKDLGMLDLFDCFVGMSAGSFNLAHVLAGQSAKGVDMYVNELTHKDNLDILRIGRKETKVMDLRGMYGRSFDRKAINFGHLAMQYGDNFYVALANVSAGKGELITPKQAGGRMFEYLMAGATLPYIAGEPWKIQNQDYYDGGIFYIKVEKAAQELGCTHVLTLNTQYEGYVLKPFGKLVEKMIKGLDEQYHDMGSKYLDVLHTYCDELKEVPYGEAVLGDMHMYRHVLKQKSSIKRLTTDREVLLDGIRESYQSVLDLFYPQATAGFVPTML